MENIKNFIISEYESKHYSLDEMLAANKELVEWLEGSNDYLNEEKEQW